MQTLLIFNLIVIIALSMVVAAQYYINNQKKKEIKLLRQEIELINNKAANIFDEKQEFIGKQKACIEYIEKKHNFPSYRIAQLVNSNKDLYPDN